MPPKFAAIVLAAGGSSRFGRPKQLLPFEGKSLLRRACETAMAACDDQTLVVLGSQVEEMRAEVPSGVEIVVNDEWQTGMASSIRRGVLGLDGGVEAAVIVLADQPMVTVDHLRRLLASVDEDHPVCASRYEDGRLGVPAAFQRSRFEELLVLEGDKGAQGLLEGWGVTVEGGRLADIDTAADYESL